MLRYGPWHYTEECGAGTQTRVLLKQPHAMQVENLLRIHRLLAKDTDVGVGGNGDTRECEGKSH